LTCCHGEFVFHLLPLEAFEAVVVVVAFWLHLWLVWLLLVWLLLVWLLLLHLVWLLLLQRLWLLLLQRLWLLLWLVLLYIQTPPFVIRFCIGDI
jgi:hypothetical protein